MKPGLPLPAADACPSLPSIRGIPPHMDCIPCLLRQAKEALELAHLGRSNQVTVMREVLQLMSKLDWTEPPPFMSQAVHRQIRQLTGNPDPYAGVKRAMNRKAARLCSQWRRRFQERYGPLEASVRLSIAGNLLDVGAKTQLSESGMDAALERALTAPLHGSLKAFSKAIREARSILFLADNAGEILFDRELLAQLPLGAVAVGVRGQAVLNDATVVDAQRAGLGDFCKIISNGSDAPGTLLPDCSSEFRRAFAAADLIIAKGQGNYESLAGLNQHIFFLFQIKCEVLRKALDLPVGSLVIHHQQPQPDHHHRLPKGAEACP